MTIAAARYPYHDHHPDRNRDLYQPKKWGLKMCFTQAKHRCVTPRIHWGRNTVQRLSVVVWVLQIRPEGSVSPQHWVKGR